MKSASVSEISPTRCLLTPRTLYFLIMPALLRRSCGGGISRQQRRCRRKPCKGRSWSTKYKICNPEVSHHRLCLITSQARRNIRIFVAFEQSRYRFALPPVSARNPQRPTKARQIAIHFPISSAYLKNLRHTAKHLTDDLNRFEPNRIDRLRLKISANDRTSRALDHTVSSKP